MFGPFMLFFYTKERTAGSAIEVFLIYGMAPRSLARISFSKFDTSKSQLLGIIFQVIEDWPFYLI